MRPSRLLLEQSGSFMDGSFSCTYVALCMITMCIVLKLLHLILLNCSAQLVFFLVYLAIFTSAIMIAVEEEDPTDYSGEVNVVKSILELLAVTGTLLDIFKQFWNFCIT